LEKLIANWGASSKKRERGEKNQITRIYFNTKSIGFGGESEQQGGNQIPRDKTLRLKIAGRI